MSLYEYFCIMIMSRSSRSWPPKRSNRYPCLVHDSSSGGDERINPRKKFKKFKKYSLSLYPTFLRPFAVFLGLSPPYALKEAVTNCIEVLIVRTTTKLSKTLK